MSLISSLFTSANNAAGFSASSKTTLAAVEKAASLPVAQTAATSTGPADAFLLDLSDEAKSYLSGSANNPASSLASSASSSYQLTENQQDTLADILKKYADKPLTEENFASLQGDLKAAGLAPEQLAQEEKIRTFNPTQALIDALSGNFDSLDADNLNQPVANQDTKTQNFLSGIVAEWKKGYEAKHPETDDATGGSTVTPVAQTSA